MPRTSAVWPRTATETERHSEVHRHTIAPEGRPVPRSELCLLHPEGCSALPSAENRSKPASPPELPAHAGVAAPSAGIAADQKHWQLRAFILIADSSASGGQTRGSAIAKIAKGVAVIGSTREVDAASDSSIGVLESWRERAVDLGWIAMPGKPRAASGGPSTTDSDRGDQNRE